MYPKQHIIIGFIFAGVLSIIFPSINWLFALIIFLSSFLIDADHYFYYIIKNHDFNPKHSIKYFFNARKKVSQIPKEKRKLYYSGFCFFHGIETLIALAILGMFVSRYFFAILLGVSLHLLLDWIEESTHIKDGYRFDKISIIWDYFKYKKLERI